MGTSWISRKGGILEKGGWSRKGGWYDPPPRSLTNYVVKEDESELPKRKGLMKCRVLK